MDRSGLRSFFLVLLLLVLLPSCAAAAQPSAPANETVKIGVYMVDFNRVDVGAGTVSADFYLTLASDTPVSIDDIELMNGVISSVSTTRDTPTEKEYRIIAVLTTEPDLTRYPFDRHILSVKIEPKFENESRMILAIDPENTGLDPEADLPGWSINGTDAYVTHRAYLSGETPYSRAVFDYGIARDATSTVLKFFLPILLIVIVSLSSLLMKTAARLGLNASMFLAAVLIHWRIADDIPLVAYATFLDIFMIITYATLVMVLISGILILKYTDTGETEKVREINFWSIRIIPAITITLYLIVFVFLLG